MKNLLLRSLEQWGSELTAVFAEKTSTLRCIFQPVTSRSLQNMRRQVKDLGQLPQGQFEYLGAEDISQVEYLERDGWIYIPRHCEPIYLSGEILCYWGLAAPAGEESAWNN